MTEPLYGKKPKYALFRLMSNNPEEWKQDSEWTDDLVMLIRQQRLLSYTTKIETKEDETSKP